MIQLKSLLCEQVGSDWNSCKVWKSSGGTSYWNGENGRPEIDIKVNNAGLILKYKGRASGYAIAHGSNSTGDSLHQAFNVIMCEGNPYLMKGNLQPDIDNITTNCNITNGLYNMNIWIPFNAVNTGLIYQFNRRGGMGHDPGEGKILGVVGNVKNLYGPKKVVTNTGGMTITEYFVTYTIGSIYKNTDNADNTPSDIYNKYSGGAR